MDMYSDTYGLRRAYFIITHCVISAAIIHLLNVSGQNTSPLIAIPAADYLLKAIRMLHEMLAAFPIVARYLKTIHSLATKWDAYLPDDIRQALETIDFPSPVSTNSNSGISPPQPLFTNLTPVTTETPPSPSLESRQHSAPELFQMPSNPTETMGVATPESQQFLWTPFPESMEGMPVVPPQNLASTTMDISSMLEEADGSWAQLGRDGFAMDTTDFGSPLWDGSA